MQLRDLNVKVRSKNAGPFWLTLDIFSHAPEQFSKLCDIISDEAVAACFDRPVAEINRYEVAELLTIKFSLPRPTVQGVTRDRDMHGASFAQLLQSLELPQRAGDQTGTEP